MQERTLVIPDETPPFALVIGRAPAAVGTGKLGFGDPKTAAALQARLISPMATPARTHGHPIEFVPHAWKVRK